MGRELIVVDRDPEYAPCSYLLCRVSNPEAGEEHYNWNTRDDDNTLLIQTDWDWPGLASSFGWVACECGHTDGTVDCKHHTATDMIADAGEFLDNMAASGKVIPDPGYFVVD